MNSNNSTRRKLLRTAGALALGGLAGCNGSSNSPDEDNSTSKVERGYNFTVNSVNGNLSYDLSSLEGLLDSYSRSDVEEEFSEKIEVLLEEDGEPISFEDIDQMHLENEYGQEMASKSELEEYINSEDDGLVLELPEFLVTQGSNLLSVEYDDGYSTKSFSDSLEVTKEVPRKNGVKAEMRRDGEHLHDLMPEHFEDYRTPFRFDTVDRQTQEYQEMMHQNLRNKAMRDVVKKTVEKEEHNFRPEMPQGGLGWEYSHGNAYFDSEHFSNINPDNLNHIINDGMLPALKQMTKEGITGVSGATGTFAATAARMADVHINGLEVDEYRFDHDLEVDMRAGFHNSSRSHGQGVIYFNNRGEWRNLDIAGAITVPSEAPDARNESVFYAGNDYQVGKADNIPHHGYHSKKSGGIGFMFAPFGVPDTSTKKLAIDDNWLNNALKKPRNNERIPEHMEETLKQMMWASKETPFHDGIIYGGDVNENHLLLNDRKEEDERTKSDNQHVFQAFRMQYDHITKYRDEGDFSPVTKDEVEEEMVFK